MQNNPLWVERYRPKTVADTILPDDLKKTFQEFIDKGSIPNLLLAGSAGIGKTTVAKAICEELGCDYLVINGSLDRNIDTLRDEIMQFASTVSFNGQRKYVILDEADNLNPTSTMPALRNFMEEYSNNCGFILTCNHANRIIAPLHSRCSLIEFRVSAKDKPGLAKQFMDRVENILKAEGIEYDKKVVAEIIKKYFPDLRRVLNELQRYSSSGKIDVGILANVADRTINDLIATMKAKDFDGMRKWVGNNLDNDPVSLLRLFYDTGAKHFKRSSVPQLVLILADYQYKSAFVVDQEINMTACLVEIVAQCEFE